MRSNVAATPVIIYQHRCYFTRYAAPDLAQRRRFGKSWFVLAGTIALAKTDMTEFRLTIFAGICLVAVGAITVTSHAQNSTSFSGKAAYYDPNYKGRTASGEPYDATKFTAAHKTLPFGTQVRVTDVKTGRGTVVTINDRGPFNKSRVIDLSLAAAEQIDMIKRGIITIRAEILATPRR